MLPKIIPLKLPRIIQAARRLTANGVTQLTKNNLFCLDVDDAYVHQLFPLLKDGTIQKPDYFGAQSIGAHITIIYPEEQKKIQEKDLQKEHHFSVKEIVTAEIGPKIYYVLLVDSPSLLQLRHKYGLPDILSFEGCSIGFHITVGVIIQR